jgi:hypothetical protein
MTNTTRMLSKEKTKAKLRLFGEYKAFEIYLRSCFWNTYFSNPKHDEHIYEGNQLRTDLTYLL